LQTGSRAAAKIMKASKKITFEAKVFVPKNSSLETLAKIFQGLPNFSRFLRHGEALAKLVSKLKFFVHKKL
jgi:hypothetical protein